LSFKTNFRFCNHSLFIVPEYPQKCCQDAVFLPIRDYQPVDSVLEFLPVNTASYITTRLILYHLLTIHIRIEAFEVIVFIIVLILLSYLIP